MGGDLFQSLPLPPSRTSCSLAATPSLPLSRSLSPSRSHSRTSCSLAATLSSTYSSSVAPLKSPSPSSVN
eukprot:7379829-Prymnesium_polylepis.1